MKTIEEPRVIRPDFWLMKQNQTQYWHLDPDLMQHVDRIVQVSLFDKNEITHCCEITPSYCFFPVETRAEFKEHMYNGSREHEWLKDRIDTEIMQWADWDPFYIHCFVIDTDMEILGKDPKHYYHYGDTGVSFDKTPYDEQREAMIEHFQGNQML